MQSFPIPFQFASCAVSQTHSQLYITPDDGKEVYYLDLVESTEDPELKVLGEVEDTITGVAVYTTKSNSSDIIFVALDNVVQVYEHPWTRIGTVELTGFDIDIAKALNSVVCTPLAPYGVASGPQSTPAVIEGQTFEPAALPETKQVAG